MEGSIEGGEVRRSGFDGGGELVRAQAGRRRRSEVWEHGEGKRRRGIGRWGFCSARARDREGRRALQPALHGGIAVAAARAALRSAGARGTAGELQREAMGGGGGAARRVGASVTQNMAEQAHHCAGDGTAQRRRGKTEQGAGGRG